MILTVGAIATRKAGKEILMSRSMTTTVKEYTPGAEFLAELRPVG